MRIGFYLENNNIKDVDLSAPWRGNPGCGGTHYLFVALPYYLNDIGSRRFKPVIYANYTDHLPDSLECHRADDLFDAMRRAVREGCDLFVYRQPWASQHEALDLIDQLELPTIVWAHVKLRPPLVRRMSEVRNLKAVVCVEHEQYDLLQDTPLAVQSKLTYIVNGFDVAGFVLPDPPMRDRCLVVYLGALVPVKGFHVLAEAWPLVLKRFPEARLSVIGGGDLYNPDIPLGRWRVADSDYEERYIIPPLKDADGSPHPSVTFHGTLGPEKKALLHKALVGVVNPTGSTENCPGSALEFQACGTPVVSGAYEGMLDTVRHGETGFLGRRAAKPLAENICRLLDMPALAEGMGAKGPAFVEERYNWSGVVAEWEELFAAVGEGRPLKRKKFKSRGKYGFKLLIAANRLIQLVLYRAVHWPFCNEMDFWLRAILRRLIRR